MRTVIHVGLMKTGTTALQELVFKKMDVHYVNSLASDLLHVDLSDGKPLLISNEDLSGMPFDGDRTVIAKNLKMLFPDASIIVGLRESGSWISSLHGEWVRVKGYPYGFLRFIEDIPLDYCNFWDYVALLQSLFNDVLVYWFDDLRDDFDGEVKRIADFIGVPVPAYTNRVVNKRWNGSTLKATMLLNRSVIRSRFNKKGFIPSSIFNYVVKRIRGDL